jgi:hypothetical protein
LSTGEPATPDHQIEQYRRNIAEQLGIDVSDVRLMPGTPDEPPYLLAWDPQAKGTRVYTLSPGEGPSEVWDANPVQLEDLTSEPLLADNLRRVSLRPITHRERVRLGLVVTLFSLVLLLIFANVGFALMLSAQRYQIVGGALGAGTALFGGLLGTAIGYYFATGKD